jgi:hypothetical protein
VKELSTKLEDAGKVVRLWDDVFAEYFDDESTEEWHELLGELRDDIVKLRNRVMHHRLFRVGDYLRLREFHERFIRLLDRAETPEEEELKEKAEELKKSTRLAWSLDEFGEEMDVLAGMSEAVKTHLAGSLGQELRESERRRQEQLEKMIRAAPLSEATEMAGFARLDDEVQRTVRESRKQLEALRQNPLEGVYGTLEEMTENLVNLQDIVDPTDDLKEALEVFEKQQEAMRRGIMNAFAADRIKGKDGDGAEEEDSSE